MERQILAIDQGNSSCKARLYQGGHVVASTRCDGNATMEFLQEILDAHQVDGIVYCSVGHVDARLVETLRRLAGDNRFLAFTHSTPLPIQIRYATPNTLGLDRIAGAVGAWSLYPGETLLVADAGTAITFDVVSSEGTMMGGNISPGISLRFRALHSYTEALPLCDIDGSLPEFGEDTATAIRAGVLWGVKAEVEDTFRKARTQHGALRLVLTGGDAEALSSLLEIEPEHLSIHDDLVGLGLIRIFLHNENN